MPASLEFEARAGSASKGAALGGGGGTEALPQARGTGLGLSWAILRIQWLEAIKTEDRIPHQVLFLAAEVCVHVCSSLFFSPFSVLCPFLILLSLLLQTVGNTGSVLGKH